MIIILDTSVLIAALLSSKRLTSIRKIMMLTRKKKITLAMSIETLTELKLAITYEKFKKNKRYNNRLVAAFINEYQHTAKMFALEQVNIPITRDHNDARFLKLAIISEADYLISGDLDLLEIKRVGKTLIVKPAEFLERYSRL